MYVEISLLLSCKACSRKVLGSSAAPDCHIRVLAVFLTQLAICRNNCGLQVFRKLRIDYGSPYPPAPFPEVGDGPGIQPLKGFLHHMHYAALFKEVSVCMGSNGKSIR